MAINIGDIKSGLVIAKALLFCAACRWIQLDSN